LLKKLFLIAIYSLIAVSSTANGSSDGDACKGAFDSFATPDPETFVKYDSRRTYKNHMLTSKEYRKVIKGVQEGRGRFDAAMSRIIYWAKTNLNKTISSDASLVHDDGEVMFQSVVLSYPVKNNLEYIINTSFVAHIEHRFDDEVDRPDMQRYENLVAIEKAVFEGNLRPVAQLMGPTSQLVDSVVALGNDSARQRALRMSMWRIVCGALIQRAPDKARFMKYLKLYQEKGVDGLDEHLKRDLLRISPQVYWMTTKTALEAIYALDYDYAYDANVAALWNLSFAPLLYFQDIRDESKAEGQSLLLPTHKTTERIKKGLRVFKTHVTRFPDSRVDERIKQLKLLVDIYRDRLPPELKNHYTGVLDYLHKYRKDIPSAPPLENAGHK
jgi:hypothetical protein